MIGLKNFMYSAIENGQCTTVFMAGYLWAFPTDFLSYTMIISLVILFLRKNSTNHHKLQ